MVEGTDTKENLEGRMLHYSHPSPKDHSSGDFMMGNWNLWKVREGRNEREVEENREVNQFEVTAANVE